MSSQAVKPQSIVHHIGRLGSKIVRPISIRRKRIRTERKKLAEGSHKQSITVSESDTSSILESLSVQSTSSMTLFSHESSAPVSDDDSSQGDYHTIDSDDLFSCSDNEEEPEEEGLFETVDQNEFLLECFLTNEHSDVLFLVHFFNPQTYISEAVEDVLSIRVLETRSRCECRRIDSKSAPLFTAKLQIDPEQPTILAIKNGKVLSKVSDISSSCKEVDQWLERTRLLQSNASINAFSSLSTDI